LEQVLQLYWVYPKCPHIPLGHPAQVSPYSDGRSPDSRVEAFSILPGKIPVDIKWSRSPLTVAGAVTGLAPDGYTSPYSLLFPLALGDWEPSLETQYYASVIYKRKFTHAF